MKPICPDLPICTCGSRDFEVINHGRTPSGRAEFRLACRTCHAPLQVDKTTYALFQYLSRRTPSRRFLKLYDLV